MSLLGLPTELLENIIVVTPFTNDRSFESLTLACRTTYNVAKAHVARYNIYRRWNKVVVGTISDLEGDFRKGVCRTTFGVLHAIAFNPELAYAIESLDLRDTQDVHEYMWWDLEADLDPDEIERGMEDLFNSSILVKEFSVERTAWLEALASGGDIRMGWRVIFLLMILPNLRELTLPEQWGQSVLEHMIPMPKYLITSIAERIRQNSNRKELPMTRLERLLLFEPIEHEAPSAFSVIDMFLGLPSLNDIHLSNLVVLDDGYHGKPFRWPVPGFDSNIRKVTLDGCCFDHNGIAELLEHTPHIQVLSYSHDTKWRGCGHDWDAGSFIARVGEISGRTLKDLSLSIHNIYGDVTQGPGSMIEFITLEKLALGLDLLCAPPYRSTKSDAEGASDEPGAWEFDDIFPLVDILPDAVQEVVLMTGSQHKESHTQALRKLLARPDDLKSRKHIPHLERLVVRPGNKTFVEACRELTESEDKQSLQSMFEAAGVQLDSTKYEVSTL